jgi:23S rRNA (adenine2503-C2)-methyltransferase
VKNILDLNLSALKGWMKENNESEYRAKQIFDWIYKGTWDFRGMKNISKNTQQKLEKNFYIEIPEVIQSYHSKLEDTHKFLLKYRDGNIIESVVMEYGYGNSICISTQIGCRMNCKFCASTVGGLVRNLSCGEIISQVLGVQKEIEDRISNVVLMGSGEPLDNYDNVIEFIKIINSDYSLNIGQRRITLSTCGIVPKMRALADTDLQITLAVSLHAPHDNLRRTMMPIANRYSIDEILNACRYYIEKTNRRITFEYAIIKDVNDSKENAKQLSNILKGLLCHVNLISINEVGENSFKKSSVSNLAMFCNMLTAAGIETTIRKEMGADIEAACGQLRRSYINSVGVRFSPKDAIENQRYALSLENE